jgi:tRNA threonylcarbamoyladenosine biosynthesis protein TsaE
MARQTNSLEETAQVAAECLASLELRQSADRLKQATVLALRGDLGAGKTTFTQALARELGISENVTSPTFVIMKIYDLTGQKFDRLIHIDAYRFDTPDELDGLNFSDFLKDPKNLIVLEWPERVAGKLPVETIFIDFKFISDTVREISYS